jgi:hypothetical protein
VNDPLVGENYVATAWVKADSSPGKRVRIVLREKGGGTGDLTTNGTWVTLSGSWQQVQVVHTVTASGRTSLEVLAQQDNAATGDAFLLDTVSLVKQ